MNTTYLLTSLNIRQKEAVVHIDGPSLILAGAGSGKTRVLVSKVVYMIREKNIDPSSIIMITFTNKAAGEMKERINSELGLVKSALGYVGTFHSFCAMLLRRDGPNLGIDRSFVIYDQDDQESLIRSVLKSMDSKRFTPSYILFRISAAKNQLIGPDRYLKLFTDYSAQFVYEVYKKYQKELEKNKALDFDDLIMKVTQMIIKIPEVLTKYQQKYRYILVDEFQDTNYAQYTLTRLLGEKHHNVTVVGDFSQSIYSWRGADIKNLEKFQEDFPGTKQFLLEQNYRSTQNILNFAYDVISKNQSHPILALHTKNNTGEEVEIFEADNEQEESIYIAGEIKRLTDAENPYTSFAVLYRTNAQSRAIEEAFLHFDIPYRLIGGTRFYERKEVKDVLSYLRLLINPEDSVASERIQKIGKRKYVIYEKFNKEIQSQLKQLGTVELIDKTLQATNYLDQFNQDDPEDYSRLENIKELKSVAVRFPELILFLEQVALVESEYSEGEKKHGKDGVRLMTLHQAKGLEFRYVFIVGLEEGILPHSRSMQDALELEEERRLFYVGITRARHKLYITYARRRFIFGRRGESVKSRFLGENSSEEYSTI